jgi:hypothetical protein
MKRFCTILLIVFLSFSGCRKNNGPIVSGRITIDNTLYGSGPYYALGFSVPTGKKVSTLSDPANVISVLSEPGQNSLVKRVYFGTRSLENSFYRYGEYANSTAAASAFKSLTSFLNPQWIEEGDTVRPNQIWLFRTWDEKYAKLRIIDTMTMNKPGMPFPYSECTFEWVYQPDGTLTFPGK